MPALPGTDPRWADPLFPPGPGGQARHADRSALSVGSAFLENTDRQASKPDCALKAFRRLAAQLAQDFPQLRRCLRLDGLYANSTVLDIGAQRDGKYSISFKEGSLPAVWQEYQTLRELCPQNRLVRRPAEGPVQTFAWVTDLHHQDDQKRSHRLHAFECQEQHGDTTRCFAWLTNFTLRAENVVRLANRGGHLRWKIGNEGFNLQKNGGFALEHAYSTRPEPIKNGYFLLQMAHVILQLLERGNLLGQAPARLFGSLHSVARRLAESLRHQLIPAESLDPARGGAIPSPFLTPTPPSARPRARWRHANPSGQLLTRRPLSAAPEKTRPFPRHAAEPLGCSTPPPCAYRAPAVTLPAPGR